MLGINEESIELLIVVTNPKVTLGHVKEEDICCSAQVKPNRFGKSTEHSHTVGSTYSCITAYVQNFVHRMNIVEKSGIGK